VVLPGRPWADLRDLTAQWQAWHAEAWLPHVHRTTRTTIAARLPVDQAAFRLLPPQSYDVCERTTRQVSKDCCFSFEGSLYSAPAECAGQRIALRVYPDRLGLYTLEPIPRALGAHRRVRQRGSLVQGPTLDAPLRGPGYSPLQLPPAARALELSGPQFTPVAPFDVPVVHQPLAVYALAETGRESSHE
jgi:hypothetical protein